jgi:hypothetical protein
LFAGDAVEEEDGASEDLAFLNGFEGTGGVELCGVGHELEVAGVEVFHAATEDEVAAVDEEEVGEDVLDLVDLVGGDEDSALVVEVVVEQGVVELLAEEDVEAEGGLVEDKELGVDGHDEGEVELGDHPFGELADLAGSLNGGAGEEGFGFGAVETGMDTGYEVDGVGDAHPAGENGHVGDERYIVHEIVALGPGIAAENGERAVVGGEAEDGVEQGGLAGSVGADEAEDATLGDVEVDAVECDGGAVGFVEAAGLDGGHG